jgi:hypothetical protein
MMEGAIREKQVDGNLILVVPLTFGRARITISYAGPWQNECVDDSW